MKVVYGVAFTQSCDNDLIGVLMFKSEAKAKLVYRIMLGLEELCSLDGKLNSILDSADFEGIPEFEEIDENMMVKKRMVKIINIDEILDIE